MQSETQPETAFKNRGFTFEDIVLNNELGGIKAVTAFLDLRIQNLRNTLIDQSSDPVMVVRLQQAIRAFESARTIYRQVYEHKTGKPN